MRRKGFTLVELLVVIAIIALLMGILMPALSRVRQLAFRLTCGTNLSGIGKAMLIYSNDYEDELPRAGGRSTEWGLVPNWMAPDRYTAFGVNRTNNTGGNASISSCFYLLVKYAEVTPKSFICKGDAGTTEFKLSEYSDQVPSDFELIQAWDFGPAATATEHCSYSYHMPFGLYALTVSSEPGFAVASERNPWLKSPAAEPTDWQLFAPDLTGYPGSTEDAKYGNAIAHQNEGQNVLFLDSHVNFEKRAYCSVEDDNIFTRSLQPDTGDPHGEPPQSSQFSPANRKDAVLIHDAEIQKGRRCFAAETPTWVDGRLVPIAAVVPGQVVAPPRARGMVVDTRASEVSGVDEHPGVFSDWRKVILANGECLCVIGTHPFLLDSGLWVSVKDLREGSVLRTVNGSVEVAAVRPQSQPYVGTVYNLKIEDTHCYFVGRTGVVVRDF